MRILIVSDAWYPQINGVVRTLASVAAELKSSGHDVLLITPEGRRTLPMPLYPEIAIALVTPGQIEREINRLQPDAIHIATEGPLGWAARRVCLRRGWPFTSGFHTRFAEYLSSRIPVPGIEHMGWRFLHRFHAPSRAVLVPTPAITAELVARQFSNAITWTRGVDRKQFYPRKASRFEGLAGPILLYAGRLAVEKGIEDFLKLDVPGTKVLVGDGPARRKLEVEYPDVRFMGYRHGDDYAELLSSADVFVFPSRTDTFGLVMLEAMACGTPVAAFDVPSPSDVVEQGVTGALDMDLAKAIDRALVMDRKKVETASRKYTWAETARVFFDALVPLHPVAATL